MFEPVVGPNERSFNYFDPKGRRATIYEDVTVDTQPSEHRHLYRGWYMHFEDGRGTWDDRTTRLRSQDWFAFRDPGELWERVYYKEGAGYERQADSAVATARDDRLFDDLPPAWVEFLRTTLQVPSFMEHGLWLALAVNARDCLSDTIATANAMQAAMKQRQAQALVLYGMDLEERFGAFPMEDAKRAFMDDPAWQPTREYLERIRTTTDWCETLVAATICFEPLVGQLVRRELLVRSAARHGDVVTPAILRGAQHEGAWAADWTAELVRFVCADAEYGEANAEIVREWVAEWLPSARAAAAALQPVFAGAPGGVPFEAALANVEHDLEVLLEAVPGAAATDEVVA